jgi:stress response protein YsnF
MMNKTHSTVVAIFRDGAEAQSAANDLRNSGFSSNDIFISAKEGNVQGAGAGTGGARPATAVHEGGISGWFKSIFGEGQRDEDQVSYESALSSGRVLLSVEAADEDVDRAADILNAHRPLDVHLEGTGAAEREREITPSRTAANAPESSATSRAAADTRAAERRAEGTEAGRGQAIPVVREDLQVGKRAILRGGVRVYSRMVEEPVEENVQLREEKVRVERTPANRPVSESDLQAGREQVYEVKEYAEEPVVGKQARVVEEVRVRKDTSDRTETVRDSVRHTEVNVENLPTGARAGSAAAAATTNAGVNDADFRRHYEETYGTNATDYNSTYQPAYRYGYEMAGESRFRGRTFEQSEPELRTEYNRRYPGGTWDRIKDSVRYGWNKVTNRT